MVKSLLKNLHGKRKTDDVVPTPDLSRIGLAHTASPAATVPQPQPAPAPKTIDLDAYLNRDLDRLQTVWRDYTAAPDQPARLKAVRAVVHDLYGASGAYEKPGLTRLAGLLQGELKNAAPTTDRQGLLNLMVQACLATRTNRSEDIANAVCDALEQKLPQNKV